MAYLDLKLTAQIKVFFFFVVVFFCVCVDNDNQNVIMPSVLMSTPTCSGLVLIRTCLENMISEKTSLLAEY